MGGFVRLLLGLVVFVLFLVFFQVVEVGLVGGGEFYVYEVVEEFLSLRVKFTFRLIRVNQSVFGVELLHVEPGDWRVVLERTFSVFNWTVKFREVWDSRWYALHLPDVLFPLYLDPDLVKLACEKAGEVEGAVKIILDPNAMPEERMRILSQLRYPNKPSFEWVVISMIVGDPLVMAGMQAYYPEIVGASYSLTARCGEDPKTFSYSLKHVKRDNQALSLEATSSFSSTGWLLSAKFSRRYGDSVYVYEVKLVETSNQEVGRQPPNAMQALETLVSNPQVLALASAVIAVVIIVVILGLRR